jgi:peptidoglycan/LPS O-acetylase OafA/YrhL
MVNERRIPSLDGLRAYSIAAVLLAHFGDKHWEYGYAGYGVTTFFVVSGYLITTLLIREREARGGVSLREFYIRRAFRILPVSYLYLAILTVVYWRVVPVTDFALYWAYLGNYARHGTWNFVHLWSLSVEEQFYFLWPIIFVVGKSKKFAWSAVLIAPVARFFFTHFGYGNLAEGSFPARFDSIAVGCLLALYEPGLARYKNFFQKKWLAAIWLLVLLIPVIQLRSHGIFWHAALPVFNFAVALAMWNSIATKPWALNNPVIAWVGTISYSLYIWHMPFTKPAIRIPWEIGVAGTFLVATLSFYCVERPFLNLRKTILPTKSPKVSAAAGAGADISLPPSEEHRPGLPEGGTG